MRTADVRLRARPSRTTTPDASPACRTRCSWCSSHPPFTCSADTSRREHRGGAETSRRAGASRHGRGDAHRPRRHRAPADTKASETSESTRRSPTNEGYDRPRATPADEGAVRCCPSPAAGVSMMGGSAAARGGRLRRRPRARADEARSLVCIFLAGGADSFNMFVPGGAAYDRVPRDASRARRRGGQPARRHVTPRRAASASTRAPARAREPLRRGGDWRSSATPAR